MACLHPLARLVLVGALACCTVGRSHADEAPPAQEFAPKDGKGHVVIVLSGQTGPSSYSPLAYELSAHGYDAVLVDGNDFFGKGIPGEARLRELIARALQSPHALPGKVAVMGFSLGGGAALTYATRMPDLVAAVVGFYPFNRNLVPDEFAAKLKVPTLLMAGGRDTYKDCCRIEAARALAEAAKASAQAARLDLVEYPDAEHGWSIKSSKAYRSADTADGVKRALALLKEALGD